MSDAAAIHVNGVRKAYGARHVLTDLDLDVSAGQFLAVVGRSGCGKSTLLRLLAGLEAASSGSLRIGDGKARPNVRLMFQEPRLLPWASVIDNVKVGLEPGLGTHVANAQALAALRDVGLEDRAAAWPSILSGGQKQRVALARALVSRPAVLALDEPLGALDALTRIEMQQLIARVVDRDGFTTVLVTHDVSEAIALADRVVILERGGITFDVSFDLPRAHRRGTSDAAVLEDRILSKLLGRAAA